jgi:hypothetical protein
MSPQLLEGNPEDYTWHHSWLWKVGSIALGCRRYRRVLCWAEGIGYQFRNLPNNLILFNNTGKKNPSPKSPWLGWFPKALPRMWPPVARDDPIGGAESSNGDDGWVGWTRVRSSIRKNALALARARLSQSVTATPRVSGDSESLWESAEESQVYTIF